MCLAVPGKIIAINGDEATVDYELEKRTGKIVGEHDYQVGDYVIIQAGFVMGKIPEKEAQDALALYKEMTKDPTT
ncbi:MAG: HypC/HybG/HupF family hydrogenase formation chaperone [Nanoarchaeota archaeon]|nr:HypC/HybG/HupF family hydrogenase formation chaperone [Nanoarchaeota archaeon]